MPFLKTSRAQSSPPGRSPATPSRLARFLRAAPFAPRLAALPLALATFAFCSSCATPSAYHEPAPLTASERTALNLEIYDATWRLVNEKYFDPNFRGVDWAAKGRQYRPEAAAATDDTELYRVLSRLCNELKESHLTPLPPRRTHELRTERRVAVGMGWMPLEGRLVVTDLIPGGPAEEAGVLPGWVLLACEGRPLSEAPPLTPRAGQPITYTFLDLQNEARSITFQPELVRTVQRVARDLPGGQRYLRFDKFDRKSLSWLNRELKAHRDGPGVVIDLRDNPGGYVFAANIAIGEFFNHRVATGHFIRRNGRTSEGHGLPLPFLSARYRGPLVVLTGPSTGSAAEIFAHVMQHYNRATIVGRRTAGAVIVSRTYNLPGGGKLQIPIQDYRGLNDERLEGRGVMPDIAVPSPALADLRAGRDPDLDHAIAAFTPKPGHLLATAASGPAPLAATAEASAP